MGLLAVLLDICDNSRGKNGTYDHSNDESSASK